MALVGCLNLTKIWFAKVLQDPSVASSTLDQRISFLQSKNLTQEEIDLSLARAGDGSTVANPAPSQPANQANYGYQNQHLVGHQPGYGYGPYQGGFWGMPPEPPRRDWRDWFIMATVSTGVSYGLYVFAKRYILPLISPPTPSQLASDKAAIDESFSRAFALIDQLAADTASIKSAEAERTEKLDTTLRDVESVISDLKTANSRRETESRILADQVHGLKDLVPKALDGWKAGEDKKLEELSSELRSLKLLVANRLGGGGGAGPALQPSSSRSPYLGAVAKEKSESSGTGGSAPGAANSGDDSQQQQQGSRAGAVASKFGLPLQKQDGASRYQSGGKVTIPSWQLPAAGGNAGGGAGGSGSGGGGGSGVGTGNIGGSGGEGVGGSSNSTTKSEEHTAKDSET